MRGLLLAVVVLTGSGCYCAHRADRFTFEDPDGGLDAGPSRDGGGVDGGASDGAASDAPTDGGLSCGTGLTACDATCVDLESTVAHCGACGTECPAPPAGAEATCIDRVCGFECEAGRADCDEDLVNGCEVDTETDVLHCGGCDASCVNALSCRAGMCRPRLLWAQNFGSTGSDYVTDMAFDAAGNLYVIGTFSGTVSFGGPDRVSAGSSDLFVASYTPAGAHRWSLRGGGPLSDSGEGIAVDASGNVHVVGTFEGSAGFGGTALTSDGGGDVVIASYNSSSGAHDWSTSGGGVGNEFAGGIAVDATDNVYVVGRFYDTATFGATNLVSLGSGDLFVASYTSSGAPRWSRGDGGTGDQWGAGVVVDGVGNVVVLANFGGTMTVAGNTLTSAGGQDVFLVSYTSSGTPLWSTSGGGPGVGLLYADAGFGLDVDILGNVYVAGTFSATAGFGGGPLVSTGFQDAFVASYTSAGVHRWSVQAGGPGIEWAANVAVRPDGTLFVAGRFDPTVVFGDATLVSAGGIDIFVGAYGQADGAASAALGIGGPAADTGGIAVRGDMLCVFGSMQDTVLLGDEVLIAAGSSDALLACFEL